MSQIEIEAVLEAYTDEYKDTWEKTRWLGYITAATMGGCKSPQELMKFEWDKEEVINIQEVEEVRVKLLDILEKI
jgi:hypothetical protein